ncbi:MAG: M1 family metallopeptidase [Reichenbachiella sp.]
MSCTDQSNNTTNTMTVKDMHSFSDPNQSRIEHLVWTAQINFEEKKILAEANFTIRSSIDASQIVLDTKMLKINSVKNGNNEALTFELGQEDSFLGSSLTIDITPQTKNIIIGYETSPEAEAVQWLDPVQTAGKASPFLFTQSQAILARSWIPIQDSPGIRFTYEADVTVPNDLLALMSASNPIEKNSNGLYHFEMKQPIPAYLMALTVGDITFAPLGTRSGVYAEPSMLDKSAAEFEDLEKMIASAESLYGKYQWDRYDLIVLPPSFPFGGMENPRLTFATPTILAGDKSLTSLVAHELAHSWSGNLVTNATWDDFWLNEGFTVYFEYRIMEAVYGREYSEMLSLLSYEDLNTEVSEMIADGNELDTHLKLNLTGRNPDDGMTTIAYDKGYFFLRLIEETVGRERFDDFLKSYFTKNAFEVMTTEDFITILERDLFKAYKIDMDPDLVNNWIYGKGVPSSCPVPVSDKFTNVEKALVDWHKNENTESLIKSFNSDLWSTHEWLHFLRSMPDSLSTEQMTNLDLAFSFTQSNNSEITASWLKLVIASQYENGYAKLESFLINTGRRKFLTPLYKEMLNKEEGVAMAKAIYEKARPNYHFVSYSSIDELLSQ